MDGTTTSAKRWLEDSFGAHFTVSPLEGMMAPLTEAGMQVVFTPEFVDDDIRQEGVLCAVEVRTPPRPYESLHDTSVW